MARSVPYNLQTFDNPNPLARFAHRARYARSLDLIDRLAKQGGAVLDFGAGTGEWLRRLRQRRPDLVLSGYEPFKVIDDPSLTLWPSLDRVPDRSVDLFCAFEVLEHLGEDDLGAFVAQASRMSRAGGLIVVSVPIVEGLALPVKLASRAALFRDVSGYSAAEIVAGTFGRPVRRAEALFWSHKGFAHRDLIGRLRRTFSLRQTLYSPFPALPWWLNSQVFHVLANDAAEVPAPEKG